MGTFNTLDELLNTTLNMTVLRNNSAQDDGVDTIDGVSWFTFNGVVASKIYVSGNSFIGFGSNNEHLKVCRRDTKMWYLYRQEGVIGAKKFLKIRWRGYAAYSSTSASDLLEWELFLFDDGGMYLNIISVSSNSSYIGTNQSICGSNTYSFTVSPSTPVAYSFLFGEDGKYTVSTEKYPIQVHRVPSGRAEFAIDVSDIGATHVVRTNIVWDAVVPEETSILIYAKLSDGEYMQCENGGMIKCIDDGQDLTGETLYVRVDMSTTDTTKSPVLKDVRILISDISDANRIVLLFDYGVANSIQRSHSDVTISYDGSGSLIGQGGPVLAFDEVFTPVNLNHKDNPHVQENIKFDIEASSNLIKISYISAACNEHIEFGIADITGSLKHIDDL